MPEVALPLAGGGLLPLGRPLVMGILNATPDSFSDGGLAMTPTQVAARAAQVAREGADLLDVGGESTRPGHEPVTLEEELRRVLPAIFAIRAAAPGLPISIDTRKGAVARAALEAGAHLVNDVGGLTDPGLARAVAEAGCAVVLMRSEPLRGDPVAACRDQLAGLLQRAEAAGIPRAHTILDPGIGFGDPPGSDVAANLALLQGASSYGLGRPVLVGASRKRFIGTVSGEPQAALRLGGSVAAAVLAVQAGASIVRVHDVAPTVQALRVLAAAKKHGP